jgi:hypothetical protein
VMRVGMNRFMNWMPLGWKACGERCKYIMTIFRWNFIHYMYFAVLLQYNAVVTGGDQ